MIGVILNTYKRPETFRKQLEAVRNQTKAPDKVIVWRNDGNFPDDLFKDVDYVKASRNMGVWARLGLARDLKTDFICVLDDDTIPGPKWFELCYSLYQQRPSLYCAHGFRFKHDDFFTEKNFHDRDQFGYFNNKPEPTEIDWGGHGLFFDRSVLLKSLSVERVDTDTAGEDAHLAYSAQLIGQSCYVTPYDAQDKSSWGSLNAEKGNDKNATHRVLGQRKKMIKALNYYKSKGWEFCVSKK
jgi:hypothetical protein